MCGNDMRQVLTYFEAISHRTNIVTFEDVRNSSLNTSKDMTVMMSAFDACTKLLNRREMNVLTPKQRLDLFFIDFDMVPMLI